jgi:adenylylsulfate kinase-like enzyme
MIADPVLILWLLGPSGVGKTALGREIYRRLGRTGITAAYIDTHMIGLCYPAPEDDPFHRLKAQRQVRELRGRPDRRG